MFIFSITKIYLLIINKLLFLTVVYGINDQIKNDLKYPTVVSFDLNSNEMIGFFKKEHPTSVTNLTSVVGKTVNLNCSLYNTNTNVNANLNANSYMYKSYPHFRQSALSSALDNNQKQQNNEFFRLNPTWLKADVVYDANGLVNSYKTENIIVTRKGIIADVYRDKMKLISLNENKLQTLRINEVDIRDEGKYICREFNSQVDKLFYLNVYSPIKELSIKFSSNSKYFREVYTSSSSSFLNDASESDDAAQDASISSIIKSNMNDFNYDTSTVSIKENDELIINCIVNSSKPAANISIWITNRQNRRSSKSSKNTMEHDADAKQLNIIDSHTYKNRDGTLKSVSVAKYVVNRNDNHKLVTCIAENHVLNEKWETKRILNVLYAPKCSKNQKLVYNTGINQSIELECHMTEANPPYLDFTWNFGSYQSSMNKDRIRSNGFISRINWTPKSELDFGEISCSASNGLEAVECRMLLQLGGAPNPPFDCYHKENNRTIIIECKPGFDQGDPEVYFYLLKKKSNGVLVEYARKRDSCSFLISSLILEEHLNDFFIYSSNKYGNNKELAAKITIENKEFLLKNSNKLQDSSTESNKRFTIIGGIIFLSLFLTFFLCCIFVKCKTNRKSLPQSSHLYSNGIHQTKNGNSSSLHHINGFNYQTQFTNSNSKVNRYGNSTSNSHHQFVNYHEPYKYLTNTANHYSSKSSIQNTSNGSNGHNLLDNNVTSMNYSHSINKLTYESAVGTEKNIATSNSSCTDLEQDQLGIYDNNSFKKSLSKLNSAKSALTSVTALTAVSVRSPSLINNLQDLDMSPKSKRKSIEKSKEPYACSRSLIDETTETDSENYVEFNRTKIKADQFFDDSNSTSDQDQKIDYFTSSNYANTKAYLNRSKPKENTTAMLYKPPPAPPTSAPKTNGLVNGYSSLNGHKIVNGHKQNGANGISVDEDEENDEEDDEYFDDDNEYSGIASINGSSVKNVRSDRKPNGFLSNSLNKKSEYKSFGASVNKPLNNKTQIKQSNSNMSNGNANINELYENNKNASSKEDKEGKDDGSLLNWSKNNLQSIFANMNTNHDTISLDVDDEKVVGILV